MDYKKEALILHKKMEGKISVVSKKSIENRDDLSLLYTPGVAEPCKEIHKDPDTIYDYTSKGNLVAVVSDGSAVLGLGNIGGGAGMPVMEGKAVLFKEFGGVDAFPICLNTQDADEIISIVKALEPTFGGINLEDISAPRCFYIEDTLKKELSIPVFHDDQHGTAIVTLAGLINALEMTGKKKEEIKVVINGAGSAGTAIAIILKAWGVKNFLACDSKGIITLDNTGDNEAKKKLVEMISPEAKPGTLKDAIVDCDVFIGVSVPNVLVPEDLKTMAPDPIIFAMSNPDPEILPDDAYKGGAKIVATGRSDFKNQINNVLAFPGIFRGAIDVRAKEINEEMKIASAYAIAELVTDEEKKDGTIIPSSLDKRVGVAVAFATAKKAMETGVARITLTDDELRAKIAEKLKA